MADSAQITCPRCGYDLSGALAAAQAAPEPKPTQGTCSECGLSFAWQEVISGKLHTPRFSYEHGGPFNLIRFSRTFFRSLFLRLWGPLEMVHEIRVWRLAAFVIASLVVLHLAAAMLVVAAARYGDIQGWEPSTVAAQSAAFIATMSRGSRATWPPPIKPPNSPVAFVSASKGPVTIDDLKTLLTWPYGHSPTFDSWGGQSATLSLKIEPIVWVSSTLLGPALLLLLLRQTRRRFHLRKLHVWRAICLAAPVLLGTLALQSAFAFAFPDYSLESALRKHLPIGVGLLLTYHTAWWWAFTRRYLRAPHALGIASSGVVIGGLCLVLLALVWQSNLLYQLL